MSGSLPPGPKQEDPDAPLPPRGILGLQCQGRNVPSDGTTMEALAGIKKLVDAAQHIVILTGAGISAGASSYSIDQMRDLSDSILIPLVSMPPTTHTPRATHTTTESGIPTFRGAGGLWRTYAAQDLATPQAFGADPGLVWEFYHYRREVVSRCRPNQGHVAVAALQRRLAAEGRRVSVITQNIDRLHQVGC